MSEIKILKVELLKPHPDNPRKDLGDLSELTNSIKQDGIFQNLTVIPNDDQTYTVIIGHRRLEASKRAGLTEVPCTITEMDEKTQASTMLAENMQRQDLTVYEQAQGFQMCLDLGMTANEVSKTTGLSKTTVKHRIALLKLDQDKVKDKTSEGATILDFMKLEQIKDMKKRNEALESIGTNNFDSVVSSAIREEKQVKNFVKLKKILKSFATEIQEQNNEKHNYIKRWMYWNNEADFDYAIPEDVGEKKYVFTWQRNNAALYVEYTKEEIEQNKKPSKEKIKDEKRRNTIEKLKGLVILSYDLRNTFIKEIIKNKLSKAQEKVVWKYSAIVMSDQVKSNRNIYGDSYDINEKLMVEFTKKEDYKYGDIITLVEKDAIRALLVFTYARLDYINLGEELYDWDGIFEKNEDTSIFMLCYEMLEELGYQKCDDEIAFIEGTHKYYAVEDEPEEEA